MIERCRSLPWWILLLAACAAQEPGPVSSPREQSRAKVRFDRAVLDAALDSLAAWHVDAATGWQPAPGARREAIAERFAQATFVVPEELLSVWGRHDGSTQPVPYVGTHVLLSSAAAHAAFDSLRADPRARWRHNWIPVLRDGSDWIAIDASRSEAPAGPLVHVAAGIDPSVVSTNLTRYLQTWATAIGAGLVRHTERPGYDLRALVQLHRTFNDDLPGPWTAPADSLPR